MTVLSTTRNPDRADALRQVGVDHVLDAIVDWAPMPLAETSSAASCSEPAAP